MTFGTASKKFCLTTMHSISIFSISTLHSCFLINANDRIKADKFTVGNKYDSDESFICAIIKVQLGKEESLTEDEANAIAPWKLDPESDQETLDTPTSEFESLKRARDNEKKRKSTMLSTKSVYDPAIKACVGGSAAEVERVWSMAGHVLTKHRSSMSPLVFELIMYLKYNSRLWGLADLVEANKRRKQESVVSKNRLSIQKERLEKMKAEVFLWDKVMNALNDIKNVTTGDVDDEMNNESDEGMKGTA